MDTTIGVVRPICFDGCEIVCFPHHELLVFALLCESVHGAAGSVG